MPGSAGLREAYRRLGQRASALASERDAAKRSLAEAQRQRAEAQARAERSEDRMARLLERLDRIETELQASRAARDRSQAEWQRQREAWHQAQGQVADLARENRALRERLEAMALELERLPGILAADLGERLRLDAKRREADRRAAWAEQLADLEQRLQQRLERDPPANTLGAGAGVTPIPPVRVQLALDWTPARPLDRADAASLPGAGSRPPAPSTSGWRALQGRWWRRDAGRWPWLALPATVLVGAIASAHWRDPAPAASVRPTGEAAGRVRAAAAGEKARRTAATPPPARAGAGVPTRPVVDDPPRHQAGTAPAPLWNFLDQLAGADSWTLAPGFPAPAASIDAAGGPSPAAPALAMTDSPTVAETASPGDEVLAEILRRLPLPGSDENGPAAIRRQQRDLLALGFDLGQARADGVRGRRTAQALDEFRLYYLPARIQGRAPDARQLDALLDAYADLVRRDQARFGVPARVLSAIELASIRTGADFPFLMELARVESNFDPLCTAELSSAAGLYQFTRETWLDSLHRWGARYGLGVYADQVRYRVDDAGRRHAYIANPVLRRQALALRYDPRLSALMVAEFVRANGERLQRALGQAPGRTELYLAHFFGVREAVHFLQALHRDGRVLARDVFPRAAASNVRVFQDGRGRPRTLAEVYAFFRDKFDTGRFDGRDPALALLQGVSAARSD